MFANGARVPGAIGAKEVEKRLAEAAEDYGHSHRQLIRPRNLTESLRMSTARSVTAEMAPIHYVIDPADLHGHRFAVTLTIAEPAAEQVLALPAWIPGSYLVREFAKNLQNLAARQGRKAVALTQLGQAPLAAPTAARARPWCCATRSAPTTDSVRTAWLDADRGFFNRTSLCLQVVRGKPDATLHHRPHCS